MDFGAMEMSWEEGDVISKILNENKDEMSFKNEEKTPMKSLYEEFLEIGEKYEFPPRTVEVGEFNCVERSKETEVADEQMMKTNAGPLNRTLKKTKKMFNPSQFETSLPSKLSTRTSTTNSAPFVAKAERIPSEESNLSTKTNKHVTKTVVRPPPGFPAKPKGEKPTSNTVQRLLNQSPPQELKPTATHFKDIPNIQSSISKTKPSKLSGMMKEFECLSVVMDQEIHKYENQLLTNRTKDEGRIDMMKTLYYEQQEKVEKSNFNYHQKIKMLEKQHQEKMREMDLQHQRELQKLKKNFEKEKTGVEELQIEFYKLLDERQHKVDALNVKINDLQSESLDQETSPPSVSGGDDVKKLQNEFNNELYEREEEIDRLNATISDLRYKLEAYEEGGHDHIAWENEELTEKLAIKDEYISTLKLQIENLEKVHQQDEWELSQADDNLEMVERKATDMERKATVLMTKMKTELIKERQLNQQLHQHIATMDANLTQIAQYNNVLQKNKELDQANREKLARMTKRSVSRKSSIDLSNDVVMKSLGWRIAPSQSYQATSL
ncbi:microtubule-associated tumor suppressor 1 homolog [Clytia hemisphaerica]|uniref:Uncharacterized protein n=1 Tax=Clytia hemisphaerica TaxID=252671 RepID=A0A7M5XFM7_9CNID